MALLADTARNGAEAGGIYVIFGDVAPQVPLQDTPQLRAA